MSLERTITAGNVSYIARIEYDKERNSVVIAFQKSREDGRVDRILKFSGIENFRENRNDHENDVLDSLVGLEEYARSGRTDYVVRTEMRELIFSTTSEPWIRRIEL